MAAQGPRLDFRQPAQRTFLHLLLNTLLVSVINFTVWFAVTFWVYLETRSVFATGMIAGIFLVAIAVDRHLVRQPGRPPPQEDGDAGVGGGVAARSTPPRLVLYLITPDETFTDPAQRALWVFIVLLMFGVIAGNIRTIALPTLVTVLIPADRRDRANGLVGTTTGVSFLVTSVISGILVAAGGMCCVLVLALGVLVRRRGAPRPRPRAGAPDRRDGRGDRRAGPVRRRRRTAPVARAPGSTCAAPLRVVARACPGCSR